MIQFLSVIEWIKAMSCDPELSAGALRTGVHLAVTMNRKTGQCCPSARLIAEQTNQSQRTVERSTQLLAKQGWVEIGSTVGRGNTCQYILINTDTRDVINGPTNTDTRDGNNEPTNTDTRDGTEKPKYRHPCQQIPTPVTLNTDTRDMTSNEGNRGIEPGYRTGGERGGGNNRGKTREQIPHDFRVTKLHRDYAKIHMLPNPDDCLLVFINHHQSKATLSANWDAEFRKWLVNEKRYKRPGNGTHSKSTGTTDSYAERLDRAEAIILQQAAERGNSGDQAALLGDEEQLPPPLESAIQGRSRNG